MKIALNRNIASVVKVSTLSLVVSCGTGGSKKNSPTGIDMSGLNPKQLDSESEDAEAEEDIGGEDLGSEEGGQIEGEGVPVPTTKPKEASQTESSLPNEPADMPPADGVGTPSKEPDIQKIFPKTGIRNFAQINATMSFLTGVPTTNAQVSAFYTAQATSLPTDNDVKGFVGSQQVAVFKLAVEYCDVLVKDTTLRATVFGNFNFAGAPNVAFNADSKKALADSMVTKFWGKNLSTLAPHTESVSLVVTLIDDLLSGRDLTVATQTPGIVTGVCAGVLSSAPVSLY